MQRHNYTYMYMCMYILCMCIAHYIAKVVVEEVKKGRKPRPNKLHVHVYTPVEHKQTNIYMCMYTYETSWGSQTSQQSLDAVSSLLALISRARIHVPNTSVHVPVARGF